MQFFFLKWHLYVFSIAVLVSMVWTASNQGNVAFLLPCLQTKTHMDALFNIGCQIAMVFITEAVADLELRGILREKSCRKMTFYRAAPQRWSGFLHCCLSQLLKSGVWKCYRWHFLSRLPSVCGCPFSLLISSTSVSKVKHSECALTKKNFHGILRDQGQGQTGKRAVLYFVFMVLEAE